MVVKPYDVVLVSLYAAIVFKKIERMSCTEKLETILKMKITIHQHCDRYFLTAMC